MGGSRPIVQPATVLVICRWVAASSRACTSWARASPNVGPMVGSWWLGANHSSKGLNGYCQSPPMRQAELQQADRDRGFIAALQYFFSALVRREGSTSSSPSSLPVLLSVASITG